MTITYYGQNTQELGYLLYKNPGRPQTFQLSFGKAHIFYPELTDEKTTAALLLDIDPVDLARGKGGLFDYVNDRPYVSSSFMSTAIANVFGTAMSGRADEHQALSDAALDLRAEITMMPCRGEQDMINRVFEPLGYAVSYETFTLDDHFPAWGLSKYVNLTIRAKVRLRDILNHIYTLIPVFDSQKHYWVGQDEVEKLLRHGETWLHSHPEKNYITLRYLKHLHPLVNSAFERLAGETPEIQTEEDLEEIPERKLNLNAQRLGSVLAALKSRNIKSVIDLGCGEGHLLQMLAKEEQFTRIAGVDISHLVLSRAAAKINKKKPERVTLFQGSLTYKDARFSGYDAACVIEVIEHIEPCRLKAFERVLFEYAKPSVVIITTPNIEYNIKYDNVGRDKLRHRDHRFEWTQSEFRAWAEGITKKFGYFVRFSEIGEHDEIAGAPTQMGIFTCL